MKRIDLKLNEYYGVTWQKLENGLPGPLAIITVKSGEHKGLSFVCEGSYHTCRSDKPDDNKFTYNYTLLSYPENKNKDENYRLTEEDKSHILQLMLNFIKEYQKYDMDHTIWLK